MNALKTTTVLTIVIAVAQAVVTIIRSLESE